jgi:hypothetical protein
MRYLEAERYQEHPYWSRSEKYFAGDGAKIDEMVQSGYLSSR